MASISSILSILVKADTGDATSKLRQFDDKMAKTRAEAAKKVEAQLGASFDRRAFAEYDARLKATQDKIKNRAAFKAALGGDFNPSAFNAYQRSLAKSESDTRRMSGSLSALENRFTGTQNKVEGFNAAMMGLRNVIGLLKWPAMIAGAGLATQAVGALASGVIALTSSLAPLVGVGAAAAAGFVALGQAFGVVKLAMSGVKQGLTAYTKAQTGVALAQDAVNAAAAQYGTKSSQYKSAVNAQTTANKALQKSIAGLPPAQRDFVKQLAVAQSQLGKLRQTAGAGLFPGLAQALKNLQPLFGVLQKIVAATAKELGNLASHAGKVIGGWGKDLATIGKTNVGVIHNLGMAAISLAGALKDIVVVGGPLLTWMSSSVRTGADWIQQQVAAGRESGKLATFLAQTHAVMVQVWDIAKNLAVAFFNIGKAAAPLGRDLLNSIVLLTEKFRAWTASANGQNKMAQYFASMKAPIMAIAGLVGDIGKALIQLSGAPGLTHVVNKLRDLVPVLQNIIGSTTQGFSSVFVDALSNIVKLFGQLAGTSGPLNLLVRAIGWVAGTISNLLQSSPGMHSFVVDFVGFGAAVKALSFLPKLPIIGSLIGLFTATGKAKSIAGLLGLGGVKGGLLGGSSAITKVGTMEVGVLIAKSGGGGGGNLPLPGKGSAAKTALSAAEKDALQAGEAGGAMAIFQKMLPKIISFGGAEGAIGMPARVAALVTGAGTLFLSAAAFREVLGRYAHPYSTQAAKQNLHAFVPTGDGGVAPVGLGAGATQAGSVARFGIPGGPGVSVGRAPIQQSASARQSTQDFLALNNAIVKLEQHQAGVKQTAAALDELAAKARKVGDVRWQMADTLGAELLRTHNVASQGVMALIGQLNRLGPGARAAASGAMLQMTQMLETQGQLPLGSTARLVAEMLAHYQALRDKTGVQFRGLMADATTVMATLRQRIATSTGQQRQDAITQYNRLRTQIDATFGQMLSSVTKKTGSMRDAVSSNTRQAFQIGSQNFKSLAANIASYIGSGATATEQGLRNITGQINAALKGLGSKQLIGEATVKASTPAQLAALVTGQVSPGGLASPHAHGGLLQIGRPGQRGKDTVPLNVGGTPIRVGAGEQVAVFNHHQQKVMNAALAPMGGLPGLFSKVSTPHYMASGGIVPRGFASGGMVGYGQLEGLWTQAGGPASLAPLMAAIAEAESGGNAGIVNSIGASGLWQIYGLPFPGNPLDPITNARMAVSKWRSQGLGAWVTYTSGAYKQFLHGGVPASAFGGGAPAAMLTVPKVLGGGPVGAGVQSGLKRVVDAANAKIAALSPAGGMGGVPGAPGGPTGVGTYQGHPVANWVIAALNYAASKGVRFSITSGYRPGFDPHTTTGVSEHAGTQYPHGAVDFGGYFDPVAFAEKMAVVNATRDFKWPLLAPIGFHDDGHASGTGHARGGLVKFGGAFQHGGIVPGPTGRPTMILAHGGEVVTPGYATGGFINRGGPFGPGTGARFGPLPVMPTVAKVARPPALPSIGQLTGMPGLPHLGGKTPTTSFGAGQVQGGITALRAQIAGLEHQYSIFDQFYNLSTETLINPSTGEVDQAAVAKRVHEMDTLIAIRTQIFHVWQQVVVRTQRLAASNREIISRLQKSLSAVKTTGLKGNALTSAQSHQTSLRTAISTYRGNLSQALGDLTGASDDRDSAWLALLQLRGDRAGVAGTQAQPISPGTTTSSVPAQDPSVAILQALLTQSQQTVAISQAQYSAIQSMPAFGGSFADGGIVPGPLGAPRTIIAHGGERVGQDSPQVIRVIVEDGAVDPSKIRVIAEGVVASRERGVTGLSFQRLPGAR